MPKRKQSLNLRIVRERAKRDPNVFIEYLRLRDGETGEVLRQGKIHRDLQEALSANKNLIVGMPREHGKTTQINARLPWELGRNPNLRIAVFSGDDAKATKRVAFLRSCLGSGRLATRVRSIFPHLRIDPTRRDRENEFTVIRDSDEIAPSIQAYSIGGNATGERADLIILDDVVNDKNAQTAGERDKVFRKITQDIFQLLPPTGRIWVLHTPWNDDDAHARLLAQHEEVLRQGMDSEWATFIRYVDDDLTPVWPEKWDESHLRKRYNLVGPRAFAVGFQGVTASDEDFVFDRIQYYDSETFAPTARHLRSFVAIDPAFTDKTYSDFTAMVAGWVDEDGQVYVHDAQQGRYKDHLLIEEICNFVEKHQAEYVIVEQAGGGQRLLLMQLRAAGLTIIPAKPQEAGVQAWGQKGSRAKSIAPAVWRGDVLLAGLRAPSGELKPVPRLAALAKQLLTFRPKGNAHDDLVDAFVYLVHVCLNPWTKARKAVETDIKEKNLKEQFIDRMLEGRRRQESGESLISEGMWGW